MKRLFACLLALLLLTGCTAEAQMQPIPEGSFVLTFITVGKGDAFLLTAPEGQHYLIDTGKAQDYPQIARCLRLKGIDSLDGIFLTHGHKDHVGCLEALLQAFPTKSVYYSGTDPWSYDEILPWILADRWGTEKHPLSGGELLDLGGMTAEVWLPPESDPENENNNSLVLMLRHGDLAFLMMGDAEREEESQLLHSGMDLKADLLKLGHHGEDDASTPQFLDRVQPSIGLIAGNLEENPESLDEEVAVRLEQRKIRAWYSQCSGLAVDFISDGKKLREAVFPDAPADPSLSLSFQEVDRKDQYVSFCNDGSQPADLSGCSLYSLRRDEIFFFPEGTVLQPGECLSVACLDSSRKGDLTWNANSVWQKKRDDARLYDRDMNLLAEDRAPA